MKQCIPLLIRISYCTSFSLDFIKIYIPNTALIMLIDKIMNSLNNADIVLGLFLDFSKVFDCVNHDILIKNYFIMVLEVIV